MNCFSCKLIYFENSIVELLHKHQLVSIDKLYSIPTYISIKENTLDWLLVLTFVRNIKQQTLIATKISVLLMTC